MDSKNTWEVYTSYSTEFPFWIINPENKPTIDAFNNFKYNKMTFYTEDNLFRYTERTYDSLTILSKDPAIKYIWIDRGSSTPIVDKSFLYEQSGYYLERVSFYATGVWKMEFKRDLISLWLQFLYNIRDNNLGNVRTLTTRTNLINDNYQFEDERLQELPLKISGWKVEELVAPANIMTTEDISNTETSIVVDYGVMETKWRRNLGEYNFKTGTLIMNLPLKRQGIERTSFCEYYVFNTEEWGMVYIPKIEVDHPSQSIIPVKIIRNGETRNYQFLTSYWAEVQFVEKFWASQFLGIYILPNWLTTSIKFEEKHYRKHKEDMTGYEIDIKFLTIPFGISSVELMTIDYQIPEQLKVVRNNIKLGVKDKLLANSIFQSLPTHLNYTNSQINFQKHPDFFDWENSVMNFKYNFIFSGSGIATYYSKYEPIENWIKNLPNQLPSSTSKFAQYIQANQNTLQTGIWVKQEEAKLNKLNAFGNAAVGAGAGVVGAVAFAANPILGAMGMLHGMNQAIQGSTNFMRAENEVKFEKARVKAKYADTFNSSTRQINYSQAIDALSKEFTEGRIRDIIVYPIIDNLDVYNDTIVRYGNKTYEFFKLNQLLTIKESDKYNYFEVNAENFYKETTNYQKIWDSFTFEEISLILEWLEKGVRLWKTAEVEYEYIE